MTVTESQLPLQTPTSRSKEALMEAPTHHSSSGSFEPWVIDGNCATHALLHHDLCPATKAHGVIANARVTDVHTVSLSAHSGSDGGTFFPAAVGFLLRQRHRYALNTLHQVVAISRCPSWSGRRRWSLPLSGCQAYPGHPEQRTTCRTHNSRDQDRDAETEERES